LIEKGETLPARGEFFGSPSEDNQTAIDFMVYQGKHLEPSHCDLIRNSVLPGIPPGLRGELLVALSIEYEENGILNFHGHESETGKSVNAKFFPRRDCNLTRVNQEPTETRAEEARAASIRLLRFFLL
jgi:molecular chaperone DnaK (HSP70)